MPPVYSERLDAHLHFGSVEFGDPRSDHLIYEDDIRPMLKANGVLPKPPKLWGHGHDFPQGDWLMLGNGPCDDASIPEGWAAFGGAGDCAIAGPAHEEMEAAKNAGRPVPHFTSRSVLEVYSTWGASGAYNLETGEGDEGSDPQDVIAKRQTVGLPDADGNVLKIGRSVSTRDPGNLQHLWELAWLLECAGISMSVTEANINQFDADRQPTWDWVAGSPIVGYHYVPVMGWHGLISWAEDVYYTPRLVENQVEGVLAYIDPLRYSSVTGKDYEGFTDSDLEQFIVQAAQAKL